MLPWPPNASRTEKKIDNTRWCPLNQWFTVLIFMNYKLTCDHDWQLPLQSIVTQLVNS
jgi:hypothetical protein